MSADGDHHPAIGLSRHTLCQSTIERPAIFETTFQSAGVKPVARGPVGQDHFARR